MHRAGPTGVSGNDLAAKICFCRFDQASDTRECVRWMTRQQGQPEQRVGVGVSVGAPLIYSGPAIMLFHAKIPRSLSNFSKLIYLLASFICYGNGGRREIESRSQRAGQVRQTRRRREHHDIEHLTHPYPNLSDGFAQRLWGARTPGEGRIAGSRVFQDRRRNRAVVQEEGYNPGRRRNRELPGRVGSAPSKCGSVRGVGMGGGEIMD